MSRNTDEDLLRMIENAGKEPDEIIGSESPDDNTTEKRSRIKLNIEPDLEQVGNSSQKAERQESLFDNIQSSREELERAEQKEKEREEKIEEIVKNRDKREKQKEKEKKLSRKERRKLKKEKKERARQISRKVKNNEEPETLDDRAEMIERRYKSMKMKKILTTSIFIVLSVALLVFGTYNTFLKQEKSISQVASEVNYANRTTAFPSDGAYSFIKENIDELIEDRVKILKGTKEYSILKDQIYVTSIVKRSAGIADIHFTAKIKTNKETNSHNFMIPLAYDFATYSYSPAGELQITPVQPASSLKKSENKYISFKGLKKAPKEKIQEAETFVQNFLMIMYNNENSDVSSFYEGQSDLGDPNSKFIRLEDFELFTETNDSGYNARVKYVLELSEGLEYQVTNYMLLEDSGKSFKITSIL